ncbi:MAG: nitrate reductase cytochrome c-type subunit [Betaproteobacteria bacterium]|nr:nitrate reductase cytochrome c-type subunit [Betaproteobacteria bacterium]
MKKPVIAGFSAAALALAGLTATFPAAADEGVRSLRGADTAAEDQAPEQKVQLGKKPGLQKTVTRSFKQQPPLIPHATDNFDEITLEENQCLSCHDEANYKKKKSPLIGKSHMQLKDGKPTKTVDKTRHFCIQCHVPQFDAAPLVENTFQPVSAKGR